MKKGDFVIRPEIVDEEKYPTTFNLSVNTPYKVIHVLNNGWLVLKNYLCLVHPNSVKKVEFFDVENDIFR